MRVLVRRERPHPGAQLDVERNKCRFDRACGRLDLGVGLGWQREEYQAEGIPFGDKRVRFTDQLRACEATAPWAISAGKQ